MISTRHIALCVALLATGGLGTAPAFAQRNPRISTKPAGKSPDSPRTEENARAAQPAESDNPLFNAAMKGDAWAQTMLGKQYVGDDDPVRVKQGAMLLEAAARQQNAEALYALGMMSVVGRGVQRSDAAAFDYMRRAAEAGLADAQFEVAKMLATGQGAPQDKEQAMAWARKAADQGHTMAQFSLGRELIESPEMDRKDEAVSFLRRAAASGDATAAIFLATVKARGDFGVSKNESEAEAILMPLAEAGNPECQFALANLYRTGEELTDKRPLAKEWLKKAADGGNTGASEALQAEQR